MPCDSTRPAHSPSLGGSLAGEHAGRTRTLSLGVLDGLIDGEDEASSFSSSGEGVDLDDGRLPDKRLKVVCNVLPRDVHSKPLEACRS